MDVYVKLYKYEEVELRPAAPGLVEASVWSNPYYHFFCIVLSQEEHKMMPQDDIEWIIIQIKKTVMKKISERGIIWLDKEDYVIYKKWKKRSSPPVEERPVTVSSVDPPEFDLEWKEV